jgi:archaellum component FlaC
MAKKRSRKKPRTVSQHLTSLERLVRTGFRQTDGRFRQVDARFRQIDKRFGQVDARFQQIDKRFGQVDARFRQIDKRFDQVDRRIELVQLDINNLRKDMDERFAVMENRIDRLATHVDGFMKLHETLDIEMQVMKEQMKRFEERLGRVEAVQAS